MIRNYIFLTLLFSFFISFSENNDSKPKLVVAVVVDQMRYDFLENLSHRFNDNGFNKLINDGFNCKNNFFNYVPTVTGPGHSSISTGATPMTHGIIGNNWYNRKKINRFIALMTAIIKISVVTDIQETNLQ